MSDKKQVLPSTIFVDCFNTIIFRKTKKNDVFKEWAKDLSKKYDLPWKVIYKRYKSTNFNLSFKKLFTTLTLQEQFDKVLEKLYLKLAKKFKMPSLDEFLTEATETYIKKELDCFCVNEDVINLLKSEKEQGNKIYLVSDFYCKSDVIKKWFTSLNIQDIFNEIFSSSDFEKEKATTKLYKKLLAQLNLNPKTVTMYGDNVWSDVMMAKASGINAKRIKNKQQRKNYEK